MVLGLLIGLFLVGCEKQPTEVEKPEAPARLEGLAKRPGSVEFQIGPFEPEPEIVEKIKKLMEERGVHKGTPESLANIKLIKPEEYEKYNIKPPTISEPTISELKRMAAEGKGSTEFEEGDGWWVAGRICMDPYLGAPRYKTVITEAWSFASEKIDYIWVLDESWCDGWAYDEIWRGLYNSSSVVSRGIFLYPEGEEHYWQARGSHYFADADRFRDLSGAPYGLFFKRWTYDECYH